ncbi:3-isopropylmalate dehydratase [bacterium]|nr:3-isopropylmalate dehydratase [bacterium]
MALIEGKAYVLGHDVDTDQIIPAHHLVYSLDDESERREYGHLALSGVPESGAGLPEGKKPFVREGYFQSDYRILVAGRNFGCGSSREHAPVALHTAGVRAVVAGSYARIFYRNTVDGAYFIPLECREDLVREIRTGENLRLDPEAGLLDNLTSGKRYRMEPLGDVAGIVEAGGIFAYARRNKLFR